MLNDAQVSTRQQHFVGYGVVLADDETEKMEIANTLCEVYDNALRGYTRIYLRVGRKWEGPLILKGEQVELTG